MGAVAARSPGLQPNHTSALDDLASQQPEYSSTVHVYSSTLLLYVPSTPRVVSFLERVSGVGVSLRAYGMMRVG